MSALLWGGGLP